MKRVDVVFVILVYRNANDLEEFIKSINEKVKNYGLVIINSYYDDSSMEEVRIISEKYSGIFRNVENRGYSYGNNEGIKVALDFYEFKYLVVANPDMRIDKFEISGLENQICVAGPIIKTKTGKNQNPYRVVRIPFLEQLNYFAYKKRIYKLLFVYIVFNKALREIYLAFFKKYAKEKNAVYALHGSFLIFTKRYLEKYMRPFCDEMFLFGEEDYLAYKNKKNNAPMYLLKNIEIYHKEDGSMNLSDINQWEIAAESYIEFMQCKDV